MLRLKFRDCCIRRILLVAPGLALNRRKDNAAGTRNFVYNSDGTLANETIPHIVNGMLEYGYDNLKRRTAMTLKQNSASLVANQYVYDAQDRLFSVSDGTNTATYSRVPGMNLLDTTTITAGGNTKLTTSRVYDGYHRLTSISSESSVPSVVKKTYSYTYNTRDQRTQLTLADSSYWVYAETTGSETAGSNPVIFVFLSL